MNKDQVKGSVKENAGKLQEKVGEATNNREQEIKGNQKQGEGKADKVVGNVKDTFNK